MCAAVPGMDAWYGYAQMNATHLSDDEVAELTGLADGSGLPFDDVLLMNSQGPLQIAHSYADPARLRRRVHAGRRSGVGDAQRRHADGPQSSTLSDCIGCTGMPWCECTILAWDMLFVMPVLLARCLDAVAGWKRCGGLCREER